jgi:succinate dehydrogenase hydrophobic anchor subunit
MYWQRTFITPIMHFATIPGIWLLFLTTTGLFFLKWKENKLANSSLLILSAIIAGIGQFIINPMAKKVTEISIQQIETQTVISDYVSNKLIEDSCGGINLLLLIIFLVICVFAKNRNR